MAAYLNPQPVPPRTMAATSTAPAMEPIMILVPLGPVTDGTGGRGQDHRSVGRGHGDMGTQPRKCPGAMGNRERDNPSHREHVSEEGTEGPGHSPRAVPVLWGPGREANPATGTHLSGDGMRGHGDTAPGMTQSCGDLGRGQTQPCPAELGHQGGGTLLSPGVAGDRAGQPSPCGPGTAGSPCPRGHTDPCIAPSPPSASAQGWGRRRCSPSPSTPPGRCTSPRCCKPARGQRHPPRQ